MLPIELPAHDDGVNHGSRARSSCLVKQALDEIEHAGGPAGDGAHRIQLIDDPHPRASGCFRGCGEHQDG